MAEIESEPEQMLASAPRGPRLPTGPSPGHGPGPPNRGARFEKKGDKKRGRARSSEQGRGGNGAQTRQIRYIPSPKFNGRREVYRGGPSHLQKHATSKHYIDFGKNLLARGRDPGSILQAPKARQFWPMNFREEV